MDKKRPHDIADMRRQRQRLRRITIGALLVAVVSILGSCEGLVRRDAASLSQAAAAPMALRGASLEQRQLVLRRAGWQSDRARRP